MKHFVCDQQVHSESLVLELDASNALSSFHVLKGPVSQQTNSESTYPLFSILSTAQYSILGTVEDEQTALPCYNVELSCRYSTEEPTFVKCLRIYKKVSAVHYNDRISSSSRCW